MIYAIPVVFNETHEKCPICGFEYVHPEELNCTPAGKTGAAVSITSKGVNLDRDAPVNGRGVKIEITFGCENGCRYKRSWQFHKGNTYKTIEKLKGSNLDNFPSTIWRN